MANWKELCDDNEVLAKCRDTSVFNQQGKFSENLSINNGFKLIFGAIHSKIKKYIVHFPLSIILIFNFSLNDKSWKPDIRDDITA